MKKEKIKRTSVSWMTNEEWFELGKADAWSKKPKLPPEHDSVAASMYELGYCEGEIERPPIDTITRN